MTDGQRIRVTENGPYVVAGDVPLTRATIIVDEAEDSVGWAEEAAFAAQAKFALCRCGHSANKPFCDGSHQHVGFDGSETAPRKGYADRAKAFDGPRYTLRDDPQLCALARFCDRNGSVWEQIERSDDDAVAKTLEIQVNQCPSGRLTLVRDEDGTQIEHEMQPGIGVVEDPGEGCSGPLWVKGGIVIEGADGTPYEVRNRVALCRCGASGNKPFCDGTHVKIGFSDRQ